MFRVPYLLRTAACLVLLAAGAFAPPSRAQAPDGGAKTETRTSEHAAELAEDELARMLARLDAELGLGSLPDGSTDWPARLAAAIAARGADAPAQELLRAVADELRGLEREGGLGVGGGPDRMERVERIRKRLEQVERKLGPARHAARSELPDSGRPVGKSSFFGEDTCAEAQEIGTGRYEGATGGASLDGSSSCDGPAPGPDVWFRFVAADSGSFTFETLSLGTVWDTVLSLHSACPSGGDPHEIACSDDTGGSLFSSVSAPLAQGEEIWVRLTGYGGSTGSADILVSQGRTVQGIVTSRSSASPLGGASIELLDGSLTAWGSAVTAPDGTYSASVPRELGPYFAQASKSGSVAQLFDGHDCIDGLDCSPDDADPVAVADADASEIDFALAEAGSIAGSVVAADTGDPISEPVYVVLHRADGTSAGSVRVGPDGEYRISGAPAGGYYLRTVTSGYFGEIWREITCHGSCDPETGDLVEVEAGSTTVGIDFTLDRSGILHGHVRRDDTGDPIGYLLVYAYDIQGKAVRSTRTDELGDYEIGDLAEGTYFLKTSSSLYIDEVYEDRDCDPSCEITAGTPVVVEDDVTLSGLDFALRPKASISGEVTDEASGLPAPVRVYLFDQSGALLASRLTYTYDGEYSFGGLEAGTYYLTTGYSASDSPTTHEGELWDDLPCALECDPTTGTPITVGGTTQRTGVDFALRRRGSLSGRLVDEADGTPLPNREIVAFYPDGAPSNGAWTDDAGRYRIRDLAAGSYRVGTDLTLYADEMWDDVPCGEPCDRTSGARVEVSTGLETSGVDFAVDRFGSVSGACFDASTGEPIDVYASLIDATGRSWGFDTCDPPFSFEGIPPGTYYLRAFDFSGGEETYQDEVYENLVCDPDCDVTEGTPIVLGLGTVVSGLEMRLARCPGESRQDISETTISTYFKALACDRITVTDTTLEPGADLLLRSGRSVVLGDGFAMEPGAKLEAVIDPAWKND